MIKSLSLEQWISHVFDHPEEADWRARSGFEYWIEAESRKAALLAETFARAGELLARFSDRQLETGLWFLLSDGYAADAMDVTVPLERRLALLRSTPALFATLFSSRCSHVDFGGNEPLYRSCYMFWELFPVGSKSPEPERTALLEERFAALERIIALDNPMCQYSGLHGLGHLHHRGGARTAALIDGYLARQPGLDVELRAYALDAREGNVQ